MRRLSGTGNERVSAVSLEDPLKSTEPLKDGQLAAPRGHFQKLSRCRPFSNAQASRCERLSDAFVFAGSHDFLRLFLRNMCSTGGILSFRG